MTLAHAGLTDPMSSSDVPLDGNAAQDLSLDTDHDGIVDGRELDTNHDGLSDDRDLDSEGDDIPDASEGATPSATGTYVDLLRDALALLVVGGFPLFVRRR